MIQRIQAALHGVSLHLVDATLHDMGKEVSLPNGKTAIITGMSFYKPPQSEEEFIEAFARHLLDDGWKDIAVSVQSSGEGSGLCILYGEVK